MSKKLIYGVGINDADYVVEKFDYWYKNGKRKRKRIWVCPFYSRWKDMLGRAYSEKYQEKRPTYTYCSVCELWLTFSNFREWMTNQGYENKQLDKDFMMENNKVYSPETCVFVSQELNLFLLLRDASRGEYPIGVCWHKRQGKFISYIGVHGKKKHLGYFTSPEEAHIVWQHAKLDLAKQFLSKETNFRVKQGLQRVIDKLQYHIDNGIEIKDL